MFAVISFFFLAFLTCNGWLDATTYPIWPSPAYWNGTYQWLHANNPSANDNGKIKFCYDSSLNYYAKHYYSSITGKISTFAYLNTTYYTFFSDSTNKQNFIFNHTFSTYVTYLHFFFRTYKILFV